MLTAALVRIRNYASRNPTDGPYDLLATIAKAVRDGIAEARADEHRDRHERRPGEAVYSTLRK